MLAVGAESFKLQIPDNHRKELQGSLDGDAAFKQMSTGLAQTHLIRASIRPIRRSTRKRSAM